MKLRLQLLLEIVNFHDHLCYFSQKHFHCVIFFFARAADIRLEIVSDRMCDRNQYSAGKS